MLTKKILICLTMFFLFLTVGITVHTSASGSELAYLEKNEEKLNKENSELSSRLVTASSLSQLSLSAVALGYDKPQDTVYLSAHNLAVGLAK